MISARFDPKLFFQDAQNVALHVPAEDLFGLMKRNLDMPGAWGALVSRTSGARDIVRAGEIVEGADAEEVTFVRCTPIELSFHEERLIAADSMSVDADVTLRVRVILERGDLVSFARSVMGSRRVAQAKDVARFLHPVVRATLSASIGGQSAQNLVTLEFADDLSGELNAALQAPCFAGGLSLESSPVVRLNSESLTALAQTRERIALNQAEHEASSDLRRAVRQAQQAHVAHVTEVLERLNELAKESPDASLGELIQTFPDTQRGELYGALFAVEPAGPRTRWIVVAAGDDLLFFDPEQLERATRVIHINGSPGRVRSVQTSPDADDPPTLWLGAERGVYALCENESGPSESYVVPGAPGVQGGFNAVAADSGHVFASHSELGVWRWERRQPDSGSAILESLTRSARVVRHVQHHDGTLFCSVDNRIVRWNAESDGEGVEKYGGSLSTITALLVTSDGVFAGNSDGDVLYWPNDRRDHPERLHMGTQRAVESLLTIETHGVRRLFFAETSPRVQSRVIGDSFVRFYEAGGQTLRRAEVGRDVVVATNERRDRVFVWPTGSPGPAQSVIAVGALTGRSVQDVCLLS